MAHLLGYLVTGLGEGCVYALIALGITLVFGLTQIVNFAIGEFLMIGAFISWSVMDATGIFPLAVGAAILGVALVGLATERLVFRFTYGTPIAGFVVSLALTLIFQAAALQLWASGGHSTPPPVTGVLKGAGIVVRKQVIVNSALAIGCCAAFYAVIIRSRYGKALRACADDREAALLAGIPVRLVSGSTFVISAALAGAAGAMVASLGGSITAFMGTTYVLRGFAVALIGGLGNAKGALIGGVGLGVAEAVAVGYGKSAWSDFYIFAAVVVVLVIRPQGVFAGRTGAAL